MMVVIPVPIKFRLAKEVDRWTIERCATHLWYYLGNPTLLLRLHSFRPSRP